jgi:dienelactone hydrolase
VHPQTRRIRGAACLAGRRLTVWPVARKRRRASTLPGMLGEDWIVPHQEEALRNRAPGDIPELLLADKVSHAVADLVQATPVDARPRDRTPAEYQHHALWLMAVIGSGRCVRP